MKKMNKKGFTLIELLAVIVVLAIILVITVPTILNTLGSTRQDALQSSANAVSKYVRNQLSLASLGKNEVFKSTSTIKIVLNGKGVLCASGQTTTGTGTAATCSGTTAAQKLNNLTAEEIGLIGLNSADYDLANSSVSWTSSGVVTVVLTPSTNGKFAGAAAATSQ